MNRLQLIQRVRSLTRDFSESIFRQNDIIDFINESIDRFKQVIPELNGLTHLSLSTSEPSLIPESYQHMLALYSASRCFGQDERHYQSATLMNEFETKLEELRMLIENGEIKIINPDTGEEISRDNPVDFVELESYWGNAHTGVFSGEDLDDGVEGLE